MRDAGSAGSGLACALAVRLRFQWTVRRRRATAAVPFRVRGYFDFLTDRATLFFRNAARGLNVKLNHSLLRAITQKACVPLSRSDAFCLAFCLLGASRSEHQPLIEPKPLLVLRAPVIADGYSTASSVALKLALTRILLAMRRASCTCTANAAPSAHAGSRGAPAIFAAAGLIWTSSCLRTSLCSRRLFFSSSLLSSSSFAIPHSSSVLRHCRRRRRAHVRPPHHLQQ